MTDSAGRFACNLQNGNAGLEEKASRAMGFAKRRSAPPRAGAPRFFGPSLSPCWIA